MSKLIKGEDLNSQQRAEVLRAFVHRHLDTTSKNENEWLLKHAFYFVEDGSRLAYNRRYCEPVYMAE